MLATVGKRSRDKKKVASVICHKVKARATTIGLLRDK